MAAGVLIDTSYLITLADGQRKHHEAALRYWRYIAEEGIPIFLPTIVVSEFCIKQAITPDILSSCVVLPFNWDDAMKAAELNFSKFDRQGDSRDALKDGVKISAQAMVKDVGWIITDDSKMFYRFAETLRSSGRAGFRTIKLEDGFDRAFFEASGQRDFQDALDESQAEESE